MDESKTDWIGFHSRAHRKQASRVEKQFVHRSYAIELTSESRKPTRARGGQADLTPRGRQRELGNWGESEGERRDEIPGSRSSGGRSGSRRRACGVAGSAALAGGEREAGAPPIAGSGSGGAERGEARPLISGSETAVTPAQAERPDGQRGREGGGATWNRVSSVNRGSGGDDGRWTGTALLARRGSAGSSPARRGAALEYVAGYVRPTDHRHRPTRAAGTFPCFSNFVHPSANSKQKSLPIYFGNLCLATLKKSITCGQIL